MKWGGRNTETQFLSGAKMTRMYGPLTQYGRFLADVAAHFRVTLQFPRTITWSRGYVHGFHTLAVFARTKPIRRNWSVMCESIPAAEHPPWASPRAYPGYLKFISNVRPCGQFLWWSFDCESCLFETWSWILSSFMLMAKTLSFGAPNCRWLRSRLPNSATVVADLSFWISSIFVPWKVFMHNESRNRY